LLIGNPRSGIAVIIDRFINIGFNEFMIVCFTTLFVGGIAYVLALKLTKYFISFIQKIDYQLIVKSVLVFLFLLIYIFSGVYGIYITLVASSIGTYTNLVNVSRTHLMGVLILPSILFFAGVI
jgi:putative membrane protein